MIFAESPHEWRAAARELLYPCNVVVSDSRVLFTISNYPREMDFQTMDRSLIDAVTEYFKNPKCCEGK